MVARRIGPASQIALINVSKRPVKKASAAFVIVLEMLVLSSFSATFTQLGLSETYPWAMAVIWLLGVTSMVFQTASMVAPTKSEHVAILVSYLIKLLLACQNVVINGGFVLRYGADQLAFWNIANSYHAGVFEFRLTPYPYVLNAEFHVFGVNYLCCMLVNILMAVLSVAVVCSTLVRLEVEAKSRRVAVWAVALMPYLSIVSCELLRESLYLLFVAGSFYVFIVYMERGALQFLLMAVLLTLPVVYMHSGYFPIPLVYLLSRPAGARDGASRGREVINLGIRVILLVLVAALVRGFGSVAYLDRAGTSPAEFFERISGTGDESASGSSYLVGRRVNSWAEAFLMMPLRLLFYQFSPLPMNWRGLTDIATFILDSCCHIAFFYTTLKCLRRLRDTPNEKTVALRKGVVLVALWATLLCSCVFSMGTGTAGTAVRHRDVLVPIEAVGFAYSLSVLDGRGQQKISSKS